MRSRFVRFLADHGEACVWALMALVVLAGAVYAAHLGDAFRYGDEADYDAIAANLVGRGMFSSDGVHPTAWRPPGYPLVMAAVRALGLGVFTMRMVNFACLALDLWLLHRIARAERRAVAGPLAAALVLGYPVLFYAAGTLFPQILASTLLLLVLWLCVRGGDWRREMVVAGLAFGALILAVPYFLLVIPVVALHPWILGKDPRWRRAIVLVGVAAVVTLGWTGRNWLVFHRFVPVSTNNGINLLQGNGPRTLDMLGGGVSAADLDLKEYVAAAFRKFPGDEIAISNDLRDTAVAWVAAHKAEALKLYVRKLAYHFAWSNDLSIRSEQSRARDLVMLLTYVPLMALLVLRLALARVHPPSRLEWLLLAIYVANVFTSALFYPRIRFRLPFDVLAIALAALFLDRLLARGPARAEGEAAERSAA